MAHFALDLVFSSCSGTSLTDPTANADNIYKQDWAQLGFTSAWVQLADYQNNIYFDQTGSQCEPCRTLCSHPCLSLIEGIEGMCYYGCA